MSKKFKRFLSVVLTLVLCITCNVLPVYAVEEVDTLNELSSSELYEDKTEDIIENTETKKLVLSDTFMSYIDKSEFESHNFTKRLEEQEKLNTYVFQNDDNTRTVYYFDENLKYIDDKGQVVEKDLSIIEADNGYTIKKSDIGINLPNVSTSGIAVGYDDYSISIIPISASKVTNLENIKAEKSDGSIVYNGVFGSNTKLVYTPILSGLKEDIVLSEYVPNAKFAFTIKTNGLSIVEKDGQYFLAEAGKSESIFKLGDVIVYDAVGKPSMGRMVVKTVKESSEYVVTLEVDEDFLKDSGTVYPVTIDPSITVSDNTNGSGAIEDAPVYQGYPTSNFGSYLFNPVGTPSADFGVGRTVVRLTGLISSDEYTGITANQIINVTFHVREGSGGSSQYVNVYPIVVGTAWTESSINWNTANGYMQTSTDGGTLYGGQPSSLDITDLVKYWKDGTFPASGGFIMKSTNESINRNFLSSEYSTTSYRPYVVMEYDTVISIVPPSVTIAEGNTRTLVATTRPSGLNVTWSTSNSNIAEVNSNGVVTAKKAGSATITATTVGTDGVSYSAYCTVCVTIPDGVYYIKNKNSNYYLTTNGTITGTPDVYQYSKYTSNVSELTQIRQMWKIKHLGNGTYSVRPYNKLDMGLHVAADDDAFTPDNVDITNIGTTDTINGVSPSATWRIANAFGGYIFENYATDFCMQIDFSSTELKASAIAGFFLMNNACLWDLENVSSPPSGAYLFDIAENAIVSTSTRAVNVGTTKNLSELGLIAVVYSETSISQNFSWYSSSGTVASVDSNGSITARSTGESTITGLVYRNNTYYYVSYNTNVSALLIYQTRATYELDENGNKAEDLGCGDLSEEELSALDWLDWDDIKDYTPTEHREKWENMCTLYFANDEFDDVIIAMINHFMGGSGSPYSNGFLTQEAFEHESTQIYIENVEEQIGNLLNTYDGDIVELTYTAIDRESNPLVDALQELMQEGIYQPVYNTTYDNVNGLAICVHGLWGNKIEVTSYNISGNNYTYTLHYTLYDHFGLDAEDVITIINKNYPFVDLDGFLSWYVLQHYDEYDSAYKPFLTLIEFDVTASGTIS